jgi:protein involved in polysaccharide export with SLBB domain
MLSFQRNLSALSFGLYASLLAALPAHAQDTGPFGLGPAGGSRGSAAAAAVAGGAPGMGSMGLSGAMGGVGAPGANGGTGPAGAMPGSGGGAEALLLQGLGRGGLPQGGRGPDGRTQDTPDVWGVTPMRPLQPLPPNEFQRFVQASTGRMLPLFGSTLFDEAPAAFSPVGSVPVPASYVIGPGDEIILRSTGMLDFEQRAVVDRDGQIVLPKVGAVQVAGVPMADLEKFLTRQVGKTFRNFTLSATLGQLRSIDVYVVGQARRPGKYTLSSLSTLVNALFASGGPNGNGSMRRVRLVRSDRSAVSIDLYEFIVKGDRSKDVRLQPGDTIVFMPAGPRVAVAGAFDVPAIYELVSSDTPIREVLALTGGLTALTSPRKAQLERVDSTRKAAREVQSFALDEPGLSRPLRDGDLLTLMPISPEFSNAVTLRGNVAMPLRYPFTPGMRVRDLIPDREALITRDYWLRKNLLVQFEEDGGKQHNNAIKDATTKDAGQSVSAERARREVRNILDEVNWEYAIVERLDPVDLKVRLLPFNLGRAVLGQDESQNLVLQAGDVVTVFGRSDLLVPRSRQTRLVRVEGEVAAPGIYAVEASETLPSLLARVGGTTPEAYLFGTELNRESVRQQQAQTLETVVRKLEDQLASGIAARQASIGASSEASAAAQQQRIAAEERVARERLQRLRTMKPTGRVALELAPDAPELPDLLLEDGDRIVVPSRPSFVAVAGSVYNENVLRWRAGRTVGDYLGSAGPTDGADVDNVFVLRADGSIASRRVGAGFLGFGGNNVLGLKLAPGDTVVVPEKADRETNYAAFMRGLKDWTQIIYQLGLGAAAIKVLRN